MFRRIERKHARIVGSALVVVAVVVALKAGAYALGWEVLSLNALLSGLVAADVFLMGFLLGGVIADFKESEKLPGRGRDVARGHARRSREHGAPRRRRCLARRRRPRSGSLIQRLVLQEAAHVGVDERARAT